jgi:hypothetical protein
MYVGNIPPAIPSYPLRNSTYYPQRKANPQLANNTFKLSLSLFCPPVAEASVVTLVKVPVDVEVLDVAVVVDVDGVVDVDEVVDVSFNKVEVGPVVVEGVCSCDEVVEVGSTILFAREVNIGLRAEVEAGDVDDGGVVSIVGGGVSMQAVAW